MEKPKPDEIYEYVKQWMEEDNAYNGDLMDPNAIWTMEIKLGTELKGIITMSKQHQNRVIIAHPLIFPPDIQKRLKRLSNKRFALLWYQLYRSLTSMGVDWNATKNKKHVENIMIQYDFLYEDVFPAQASIFKQVFFEKLALVRQSVMLAINTVHYYSGLYPSILNLDPDD